MVSYAINRHLYQRALVNVGVLRIAIVFCLGFDGFFQVGNHGRHPLTLVICPVLWLLLSKLERVLVARYRRLTQPVLVLCEEIYKRNMKHLLEANSYCNVVSA